jgi:hypothetical protein
MTSNDRKISALEQATTLTGTELLYVAQGNTPRKLPLSSLDDRYQAAFGIKYSMSINAPINPSIGQRWIESGTNLVWFYDGVQWVSEQIFEYFFFNPATSFLPSGNIYSYSVPAHKLTTRYKIFGLQARFLGNTVSPQNSSNYWIFKIWHWSDPSIAIQICSVNTKDGAGYHEYSVTTNTVIDILASYGVGINYQSIGTPGTLWGMIASYTYHLVHH